MCNMHCFWSILHAIPRNEPDVRTKLLGYPGDEVITKIKFCCGNPRCQTTRASPFVRGRPFPEPDSRLPAPSDSQSASEKDSHLVAPPADSWWADDRDDPNAFMTSRFGSPGHAWVGKSPDREAEWSSTKCAISRDRHVAAAPSLLTSATAAPRETKNKG